jgi:serine protease Do
MDTLKPFGRGLWERLRSGQLSTTFALLAVLSAGILLGSVVTGKVSGKEQQHIDTRDARPLVIPSPVTLSNGFSAIVKEVGPAVVNINTESTPKQANRRNRHGLQNGPLQAQPPNGDDNDDNNNNGDDNNDMQNFLNRFFGGGGGMGQAPDMGTRKALGSGFIVDPRGYIITNNHVVDKADHIYVKLSTDPEDSMDQGRPATVVGVDPATDIAVIKIDTKTPLPTIKLGNSDGAQVGDWVLAIGSPFGLNQTVSAGIVSAKDRSIDDPGPGNIDKGQFQHFIQTDAAINPGNSGGPLVDMAGEVIGMNTAIYTQSAGSEGVGFAMPSNTLAQVYNDLIGPEHKVTRGSIGLTFQALQSSAVGRMYGFANGGVIVSSIAPGGPAAKAGLKPKDVIVTVDGKPIKNGNDLVNIVSLKHPGATVRIGYLRDGKQQTAEVGIADRDKLYAGLLNGNEQPTGPDQGDAAESKLGISVESLTPSQASQLGIKGGVLITNVRPGSFAEEIGLTNNSVVVEINRKPVTDEASYRAIVSGLKSGDDVVFVVRDPRSQNSGDTYIGGTLP